MVDSISLYFHIPYCRKKCPYCHFFVLTPTQVDEFHSALIKEWHAKKHLITTPVASIYFGGGTPSLIDPSIIGSLLDLTGRHGEITLEANPEDVTLERMQIYRSLGINRISLGVQSFDNATLKTIGRAHTSQEAQRATHTCYDAGFDNITIDLMYDLPHQTLSSWKDSLKTIRTLPISHVSLYNLTFEAPSLFHRQQTKLMPHLPSDEESLAMLQSAISAFEDMGLSRYEISAFGRPSVHNTGYWTGRPFLGFGPSAFSYWEGARFRNVMNLSQYIKDQSEDFREKLSPEAHERERLAVALRMLTGVNLNDYRIPEDLFETLQSTPYLSIDGTHAKLSEEGKLFYDTLASEIVA